MLDQHIFTDEGWRKAASLSHPTLRLRISTLNDDYDRLSMTPVKILPKQVDVVAVSGAQSCLWSRSEFLQSGFNLCDLAQVHHTMEAANAAPIRIEGAILLRLTGLGENENEPEAAVMVYVSPDDKEILSVQGSDGAVGNHSKKFPKSWGVTPAEFRM